MEGRVREVADPGLADNAVGSMFENVYAQPTALLLEERDAYAAYLDSFVSEEATR